MSIELFDTRNMIAALDERFPPKQFLLDTFFPAAPEISASEYVDIDVMKGKRKMAPLVSPIKEGKLVEHEAHSTRTIKPPYLKPKMVTTAADMIKRGFGESLLSTKSPSARAADQVARDLMTLQDMHLRRHEWMAAQALTTGQVELVGEGVDVTIDFLMKAAHQPVLTGADLWNVATSKPLEDLRVWKTLIAQDSGLAGETAVFGSDALDAFIDHQDVKDALNSRRNEASRFTFDQLADGVEFIGFVENLTIFKYSEWYVPDGGGTEQPMVPTDKVLIGSPRARCIRHYGAILDHDFPGLNSVQWFPKSWVMPDPSARFIMLQSAPIMVPHQIDAFVIATVL